MKNNISLFIPSLICTALLTASPAYAQYSYESPAESFSDAVSIPVVSSDYESLSDVYSSVVDNNAYGARSRTPVNMSGNNSSATGNSGGYGGGSNGIQAPPPVTVVSYGNDACSNATAEVTYRPHNVLVGKSRIDLSEFQNLIDWKSRAAFVYACTARVISFIEPGKVCSMMLKGGVVESSALQACEKFYEADRRRRH